MAVLKFPPVESADENGLLALGGDLEIQTLILAYRQGIFPWPISDEFPLAWFSPDPRGIIQLKNLHLNGRLKRYIKNCPFEFTVNQSFEQVLRACAAVPRKNQSGTWITEEIVESYNHLFIKELAYCVEARLKGELVGGVYGVCIHGVITGESMFHTETNASKFCLILLMAFLKRVGIDWLDTQMVTPVVKSLGGEEIPRQEFLRKLGQNPILRRNDIFPSPHNGSLTSEEVQKLFSEII